MSYIANNIGSSPLARRTRTALAVAASGSYRGQHLFIGPVDCCLVVFSEELNQVQIAHRGCSVKQCPLVCISAEESAVYSNHLKQIKSCKPAFTFVNLCCKLFGFAVWQPFQFWLCPLSLQALQLSVCLPYVSCFGRAYAGSASCQMLYDCVCTLFSGS